MSKVSNIRHLISPSSGDFLELVPPGQYDLLYESYETMEPFGTPKVCVWFKIVTFGEHFGKLIPRFYNVGKVIGSAKRFGNFKAKRGGYLLNEYCHITLKRPPRLDRVSFDSFKSIPMVGEVVTVKKNYQQKPLHQLIQYSRIKELMRGSE